MMGTFLALDLFLFYIFWEVTLVPMYFLIAVWGGARKEYAAIKFFIYTLAGSVFMLLGILALYFNSSPHTFDIVELIRQNGNFARVFQNIIFAALFLGFAVKVPVFPLSYLASRCPCGGAHSCQRAFGRGPVEDGSLRFLPD